MRGIIGRCGDSALRQLYSHNIRHALRTSALAVLKLAAELGVEDLEDPAVRVLVDEGPVKVEDDEVLDHFVYERRAAGRGARC